MEVLWILLWALAGGASITRLNELGWSFSAEAKKSVVRPVTEGVLLLVVFAASAWQLAGMLEVLANPSDNNQFALTKPLAVPVGMMLGISLVVILRNRRIQR